MALQLHPGSAQVGGGPGVEDSRVKGFKGGFRVEGFGFGV